MKGKNNQREKADYSQRERLKLQSKSRDTSIQVAHLQFLKNETSKLKKENAIQGAEGPQHRHKLPSVIAHLVKILGNPASSSGCQTLGGRL